MKKPTATTWTLCDSCGLAFLGEDGESVCQECADTMTDEYPYVPDWDEEEAADAH